MSAVALERLPLSLPDLLVIEQTVSGVGALGKPFCQRIRKTWAIRRRFRIVTLHSPRSTVPTIVRFSATTRFTHSLLPGKPYLFVSFVALSDRSHLIRIIGIIILRMVIGGRTVFIAS